MSPTTEKEEDGNSSAAQEEEEAPSTIGRDGRLVLTGKNTGLRFRLKLSKPKARNEEVESKMEHDHNDEDAGSARPPNGVANAEEPEERAVDDEAPAEYGSQESTTSGDDDSRAFTCQKCGKTLPSQKAMYGHLASSHRIYTCQECGRTFPSEKSLCGHLRSHPNKGYKGVNKPASVRKRPAGSGSSPDRSPSVSGWVVKAKRGRSADQEAAIDCAHTLMIISMSTITSPIEFLAKKEEVGDMNKGRCSPSATARTYRCSSCARSFATHQALGGHMASHNKHSRNSLEAGAGAGTDANGAAARAAATVHLCKICNETFATGQALGGHMRRHYNGPLAAAPPPPAEENARHENRAAEDGGSTGNRAPVPDLNEAPPQSEEDM